MCTVSPAVVLRVQATECVVLMSRAVVRARGIVNRRSLRFIFLSFVLVLVVVRSLGCGCGCGLVGCKCTPHR